MIEKQGGDKLLRNPSTDIPFKEDFIQELFFIAINIICQEHNIDISREARASNGRIEFKFSQGHNSRVHLEIKLSNNKNLNLGYQKQLPEYMVSEKISKGIYLVISFSLEEMQKVDELKKLCLDQKYRTLDIQVIEVDAQKKLPPSKLR